MRFRRGLLALFVAATVTGCSATISGTANPGLTPVDPATLRTGAYVPQPTAYTPKLYTINDMRLIEARRMLGYLVHPASIDADLTQVGDVRFFDAADSPFTQKTLPDEYRPATIDNNMLAGVYVSRINENLRSRKKLIVSVLRFPTDATAAKAAEDFGRIAANPQTHPLTLDGHPEVRASSRDDSAGLAFLSRGPYVILVNAGVPQPDRAAVTQVLLTTVERQLTLLDQLKPTPWDDVLDLPLDTDSIMRRALPKAPDYSDPFTTDSDFGVYTPAAELHFERNPVQVKKAFDDGGVDLVGRRAAVVYRARDLPAAFALQSALMIAGRNDEILDSPPGLPDVRCLRLDTRDFVRNYDEFCTVIRGRYVAVVVAETPIAARVDINLYQRAAAQYAILANSE
ncbi:DUF7373 family lipoprotein [Nocardia arizonensis]|uniref:DUF7373 family lipoprotein n=1 Tax=Nocardia arizonensis TaxID=1141647 RepID=UPI000AE3CBE6|nr:hypothetical protein [Nocardia arizonensis]